MKNEQEERGRPIFNGDLCVHRMAKSVKIRRRERGRPIFIRNWCVSANGKKI
ncbi:MAG: hypothetical protein FWF77_06165 [Defluviitaleaceae bacterium]|nr:hypothetical protein [Defluviitaleaceae bacterium]